MTRTRQTQKLHVEQLEDRTTPSSGLTIGQSIGRALGKALAAALPAARSVRAVDSTTLQVRLGTKFDQRDARRLANRLPTLTVARVSQGGKVVTLTTKPKHLAATAGASKVKTRRAPRQAVKRDTHDTTPPRVLGATSVGHTSVLVSFSEPMGPGVLNPRFFSITQTNVNGEAATLAVTGAAFAGRSRALVMLTTAPQNELNYTLKVIGGRDLNGNPLAAPTVVGVDPTKATFTGTPPGIDDLLDSDGDGLSDAEEAPGNLTRNADGLITAVARAGPDDHVTDPFSADTDGDGVTDFDEVRGYDVTLRNRSVIRVKTDPTNQDTDGDTASDGLERRLGGDPTDISDRDDFADDDGDGLVNFQEIEGWSITVYAVSTTGLQQGMGREFRVYSDPRKADTDGDGIPDGQEFNLGTDPENADTDGDGLTDFQEVNGFVPRMPGLGIITTDPTDADTDNDKRSDGDEAELKDVESKRWIVRVQGATPYRVYSNPQVADADFDGLVDGDEFFHGSDPGKANTDGDRRSDYEDVMAGLSPLVEDFKVTVIYRSLFIGENGDGGTNLGDIGFDFAVRKPDDRTATGLSNTLTHVVVEHQILIDTFTAMDSARSDVESRLPESRRHPDFGIHMNDNELLVLAGLLPLDMRSVTFGMTKNQRFSIEGVVVERDNFPDTTYVFFGGLEGLSATLGDGSKKRAVFEGRDLIDQTIVDLSFEFGGADNVGGNNDGQGDLISGRVSVMYIIS